MQKLRFEDERKKRKKNYFFDEKNESEKMEEEIVESLSNKVEFLLKKRQNRI